MKKLLKRSLGAFTMAEILISLTIIGIIAAITLPSLRGNINEKTWATQKKALFARMTQAIALMDSVNSYSSAQDFVTSGLSDVLKVNNICDQENLQDCGILPTGTNMINTAGSAVAFPRTWANLNINKSWNAASGDDSAAASSKNNAQVAAFETVNGESIALFYNPDCIPDNEDAASTATVDMFPYICVNMIYDLNADKGPNTMGKDIGYMTVLYATDPVVATAIPSTTATTTVATGCPDDYRLPNLAEGVAMSLNQPITGGATPASLGTSGRGIAPNAQGVATTYYFSVAVNPSAAATINRTSAESVPTNTRCIKR